MPTWPLTVVTTPTTTQAATQLAGGNGPLSYRMRYAQVTAANVRVADMTTAVIQDPTVIMNNFSAVHATLRGLRLDKAAVPASFDFATSFFSVTMQVLIYGTWVDFPLGVYRLTRARELVSENYTLVECDGSDLTVLLVQGTTATPYTVASGANYLVAAKAILTAQGLSSVGFPTNSLVTPNDFTWGPAVPWFNIVRDLMFGVNYYMPWPDLVGDFTSRQRALPQNEPAALVYADDAEPRMVSGQEPFVRVTDVLRYPNKAVGVIDDPRSAAFGYRMSTNADPTSPVSTFSQPVMLRVINTASAPSLKCIINSATASEILAWELTSAAGQARQAHLMTFKDPRRWAHESYTLSLTGEEASTLWLVESWELDARPAGLMRHVLRRSLPVAITVNI